MEHQLANFSSPEPKAQASFSDKNLSTVRRHRCRLSGPISTNLGTKHPWVKGIQVCSNEEPFNSHKVNNGFFLLLIKVMI